MILENKTILITGASSGIGSELAIQLADEKANLILLARRKEKLDELADSLKPTGINTYTIKCDVSKKEEVKSAFKEINENFSRIDIAILNAGVDRRGIFEDTKEEADNIIGVNILGLIYCAEEVISGFKKRKKGMLVGVSSLAEVRGFPKSGVYCGSKAAASIFLESIRVELKKYNIKISTVKPGFIKTPMTEKNDFYMPFLMDVKKAAEIIIKGIKKEKKIIQFPLPLVLGAKLVKVLPVFIFDFLARKQL